MKDRVFVIRENGIEVWLAIVAGKIVKASFNSKGAALAAIAVERRRKAKE